MGGGDLNMKKSWHPLTIKNAERVWKLEQKAASETQKIDELKKELQGEREREDIRRFAEESGAVEKKANKLEWMYQGPQVNREAYLLGKSIDKTIVNELTGGDDDIAGTSSSQPGALFTNNSMNTQVDMMNKVKEDPLFMIRKMEEDNKKKLLTNPVKMKQLQQMLDSMKSKSKSKRRKRSKSPSIENDSDSDCHKTAKNRDRKKRHRKTDRQSSASSDDDTSGHKSHRKHSKSSRDSKSYSKSSKVLQNGSQKFTENRDRDRKIYEKSERSRKDERTLTVKERSGMWRGGSKKFDPDEMERKRNEMADNAKWRDEHRETRVKKFKAQEKAEEDDYKKSSSRSADFLDSMRMPTSGSLEHRVKSKLNSLQRTAVDADKFMRR